VLVRSEASRTARDKRERLASCFRMSNFPSIKASFFCSTLSFDLIFCRSTKQWEKDYNKRASVERVNGRIDQVLGFELHTISGKEKMEMRLSLALVIMLSMALGRIKIGQKEKMRSILSPVKRVA